MTKESFPFTEVMKYLHNEQKMQLRVFRHVMTGNVPTFFSSEDARKYETLAKLILLFEVLDVDGWHKVLEMGRRKVEYLNSIQTLFK